ncbi:MAG: hypothetical protein HC770_06660 [Pseudanabaena sp. CRU_2_10]|nr:hypothetical protein [Pseudanabaena sp. CRU_2_10]
MNQRLISRCDRSKSYLTTALAGLVLLVLLDDGLLAGVSIGKNKVSTTIAAMLIAKDWPKCGSGI